MDTTNNNINNNNNNDDGTQHPTAVLETDVDATSTRLTRLVPNNPSSTTTPTAGTNTEITTISHDFETNSTHEQGNSNNDLDLVSNDTNDNGSPMNDNNNDDWNTESSMLDYVERNNDDDATKNEQQHEHEGQSSRHRKETATDDGDDPSSQVPLESCEEDESNPALELQKTSLLPNTTTFAVMNNIPDLNATLQPGVSYIYPPRGQEQQRGRRRTNDSAIDHDDDNNNDDSYYSRSSSNSSYNTADGNNSSNPASDSLLSLFGTNNHHNSQNSTSTGISNLQGVDFPTASETEIALYNQQIIQRQQQQSQNVLPQSQDLLHQQRNRQRRVRQRPNTVVIEATISQTLRPRQIIIPIAQPVMELPEEQSHSLLPQQQQAIEPDSWLGTSTARTSPSTSTGPTAIRNTTIVHPDELVPSNGSHTGNNNDEEFDNEDPNPDNVITSETKTNDNNQQSLLLLWCRRNIKYVIYLLIIVLLIITVGIIFHQIGHKSKKETNDDNNTTKKNYSSNQYDNGGASQNNQPPTLNDSGLGSDPRDIFLDEDLVIDTNAPGYDGSEPRPPISYHAVLMESNMGYCRNIITKDDSTNEAFGSLNMAASATNSQIRIFIRCGNAGNYDGREYLKYESSSENVDCIKNTPNIMECMVTLNAVSVDTMSATITNSSSSYKKPTSGITRFSIVYSCATELRNTVTDRAYRQSTVDTDAINGMSCNPPLVSINGSSSTDEVNRTTTTDPMMRPYIKVSMNRLCGNAMNITDQSLWKLHSASTNADSCPKSKWLVVNNTLSSEADTRTTATTTTDYTSVGTDDYYTYCEIDSTCQQEADVNGITTSTSCSFGQYQIYDNYNTFQNPECYNLGGTFIRFVQPDLNDIWNQMLSIFKIIK